MIISPSHSRGRRVGAVAAGAALVLTVAGTPVASANASDDDGYTQVNLVSDQVGKAALTDPNLVNAWGMSQGPATPVWVSDNGADVSTLYTGAGAGQTPAIVPLVVAIPGGAPTGQAFNGTSDFVLSDGQPARFIFAGEGGIVSAWNPQLPNRTSAVTVATVPGAVFKGIAELTTAAGSRLLVADFGLGRIDVLDSAFHPVALARGAFTDRRLPAGYAPFNVAVVGDRVFVAYALRDAGGKDDVKGPGHGFVDVFSPSGRLLRHFARRGVLNSPWGLAVAPAGFGEFSGDLLVGNFGDGKIHAFDPRSGELEGVLRHPDGSPIVIDGLWGLLPGNGTSAGASDLWFSAGPDGEAHGLLGVIRAAAGD
jgi:uncharacterized protein (TIGR03118 family)